MTIVAGQTDRWADRACAGLDTERFYGPSDSPAGHELYRWEAAALRVCQRCPVRAACLESALEFPGSEQHGVIGGMTAGQRRAALAADRRRPVRSYLDVLADIPTGPAHGGPPARPAVPGEVDGLVVTWLMAGQQVPGASRQESAEAAVMLHRCGYSPYWVAKQLREHDRQIYRWIRRYEAGEQLVQPRGPSARKEAA